MRSGCGISWQTYKKFRIVILSRSARDDLGYQPIRACHFIAVAGGGEVPFYRQSFVSTKYRTKEIKHDYYCIVCKKGIEDRIIEAPQVYWVSCGFEMF